MACEGLLVGGLRQWLSVRSRVLATLALLVLTACGSGDGKKRAVECQTTDDCDASTLGICDTVSCEENRCVLDTQPDGHRCDDSDPLTGEDACVSGICAGVVKTCEDDLGPCLKAVHDPETDECTVEPVDDETPCDDADACTQVDTCQAGACVGGEAKTCAASDDCHVDGVCDPRSGECSEIAADDDTPCDDGQACTTADVCHAGACAGEAVTCDDGLTCSVDACDEASGACTADMAACSCVDDADCQDGNVCNGQETCGADELCRAGTPVVCPASGDACSKSVCVAETGACEAEPVTDGAPCDDLDACTTRDTCQAGACAGTSPVVCTALSQCHLPGTCDKNTGACSNPEKPKNSSCNDGNACTATDTCQAGACVGAGQVSCTAADQCHDVGVCSTATGICSKPSKLNGVKCDDANPCTSGDACQNGTCTPASQVTCTALDSCHTVGVCDVKTGVCSNPGKPDGSACSDGLTCTKPDSCVAGKCTGSAVVCDDKIACTVDSCAEQLGGCTANATGCSCKTSADCNDGNSCNGVETCNLQTLQCQKGTNVDCSALNDACNVGACSAATGACVAVPKANGTSCDDGNLCTQASSCQAGVCQGTNPVTCAASDQCHDAGTCNAATGACVYPAKANGTTCTDGNACTQTDTCQSGVCTGQDAVVCSASDQCHSAGTCDTSSGTCSNPAKTNGTGCSDGDKCTQTDTCQGGVCAGVTVTCSASDQCHTAGTCDASTGTCSNPVKKDGSSCSDGNACTTADKCVSGSCTAIAVVCTADQCHSAGTCNTTTGVCSTPQSKQDGTTCDDNNKCTKSDTCVAGTCTGASPVTCSASDQCHDAGTCNAATGLCSSPTKPDNTACGDGKACTSGDKCTNGVCVGTTVTCDDEIACSVDSCVEPGGCSFDTSKCGCTKDADCVDLDACNGVETCDLTTLTCKRGTAVSCTALDDACNTGTCDTKTGACKATPKGDGTGCDDANLCTRSDGCVAGKCVGANPVTCSASDQCHAVGICDKTTGVCSNPIATDGTGCVDGNACTKTDTCKAGACVGASPVTCSALDQCHSAGTCNTATGVCSNPVRTGSCDDGSACSLVDTCVTGVCTGGSKRVNANGDWADDPGAPTSLKVPTPLPTGPLSVDLFTDKDETAHVVGTYAGALGFDDKNVLPPSATLALGTGQETGIYWARYTPDGFVISADNLGGVAKGGTLTVSHATAHRDGSFSLLGTIFGTGAFGINGKTQPFDASKGPYVYVVHYLSTGELAWLVYFSSQLAFTADSIAAFDDGSVIAIGANAGSMVFNDSGSKAFASTDKPGIWAARLDPSGGGQWAGTVVVRGSTAAAQAVTTHEDGSASLTGGFTGTAGLGPNGEIPVSVGMGEKGRDIWFEKLTKDGKILWGGRVGAGNADIPGDVAPIKGGGLLLLANTAGGAPNASDSKTTQQLLHATPAGLQTHVLSIDVDGVIQSDGLIANPETGVTHGWQLKRDDQGFYALAGTFASGTSFWSKVGFGADIPKNAADFSIKSAATQPGPATLFLARVSAGSVFDWAVPAGGDNSGMATTAWDVVLTAHASHSATVAGVFNTTATFGDQRKESLQAWLGADGAASAVGGGYIVHLNSQAEYDYCP